MGVLTLGKTNAKVENQQINDVVLAKARKEYFDFMNKARMIGVNFDKEMADKIKNDIIQHRIIMEY